MYTCFDDWYGSAAVQRDIGAPATRVACSSFDRAQDERVMGYGPRLGRTGWGLRADLRHATQRRQLPIMTSIQCGVADRVGRERAGAVALMNGSGCNMLMASPSYDVGQRHACSSALFRNAWRTRPFSLRYLRAGSRRGGAA